jgi:hypothetical protein
MLRVGNRDLIHNPGALLHRPYPQDHKTCDQTDCNLPASLINQGAGICMSYTLLISSAGSDESSDVAGILRALSCMNVQRNCCLIKPLKA